jgi:hypothetical protein
MSCEDLSNSQSGRHFSSICAIHVRPSRCAGRAAHHGAHSAFKHDGVPSRSLRRHHRRPRKRFAEHRDKRTGRLCACEGLCQYRGHRAGVWLHHRPADLVPSSSRCWQARAVCSLHPASVCRRPCRLPALAAPAALLRPGFDRARPACRDCRADAAALPSNDPAILWLRPNVRTAARLSGRGPELCTSPRTRLASTSPPPRLHLASTSPP